MYSVSDRFGNPHRAPPPIGNPVLILENQHTRLLLEHSSNGLDAQTPKLAQLRGRVVAFRNSRIRLVLLHTLRRDGQDSLHVAAGISSTLKFAVSESSAAVALSLSADLGPQQTPERRPARAGQSIAPHSIQPIALGERERSVAVPR